MKKIISIISVIMMVTLLFAGCSKKEQNANTLEGIKKSGKITIGLDDSYPPMEFRDSKNNLVGFDIDLGNEIGKRLGVSTEYVTTDFNGILLALNASKFNMIISGLSITDDRKKTIEFSNPYVMGGQVIAVKNDDTSMKSISDLKGKVVACQLGSTGDKAATAMKDLKEVKRYDKMTEAFHEILAGRVDAVIMDAQVGGYYIAKAPGKYKVLDGIVSKEPMGIGFKKGDTELQNTVQKVLDEMKNDGTLSKLSVKWFGFDAYKN